MSEKMPEKVWLERSELARGYRVLDLGESISTHFILYPHKDDVPDYAAYVPESSLESARMQARAEAFEEAANYLYTNDSSDEQHELIEELANDLRALAREASGKSGQYRDK